MTKECKKDGCSNSFQAVGRRIYCLSCAPIVVPAHKSAPPKTQDDTDFDFIDAKDVAAVGEVLTHLMCKYPYYILEQAAAMAKSAYLLANNLNTKSLKPSDNT